MEIKVVDEKTLLLKGARTSFMHVFTPRMNPLNRKEEYSVDILIPKNTDMRPVNDAAENAMKERLGRVIRPKYPYIKDGDVKLTKEGDPMEGYPGHWYITARTLRPPSVVDGMKNPITDPFEFYSGCYANILISVYCYNKANQGVSVELLAIQKAADGDKFGGGLSKAAAVGLFDASVEDMAV